MKEPLIAPLEWYTEKRKVKDLIPYEYYPRIVDPLKKSKLEFRHHSGSTTSSKIKNWILIFARMLKCENKTD